MFQLIHLGEDFSSDYDGTTAKLTISEVYPEDEGEYTCVAYNELGKSYTSACLVVDAPEEKDNLLSQHLSRPSGHGSRETTPRTTPRTTPTRSISPRPRFREHTSITLTAPKIRKQKLRACPPKFYTIPHNRVAEEGETVRFQCSVAGHPDPFFSWDKDGMIITPGGRATISERDDIKTLEIRDVIPEDSGIYRVVLENQLGRIEASARLDVIPHRSTSRGVPIRSASPKSYYKRHMAGTSARIGSSARFSCDFQSKTSPSNIKWYKDRLPIDTSSKYTMIQEGTTSTLVVNNVEDSDASVYKCVASTPTGVSMESSASLDILTTNSDEAKLVKVEDRLIDSPKPPVVLKGLPESLEVVEGCRLTLDLKLEGTMPFDVIWMKDGCVLPDCDEFLQIDHGDGRISLCLSDAFPEDSGDYRCEVYNAYGDAMSKCRINVKSKF